MKRKINTTYYYIDNDNDLKSIIVDSDLHNILKRASKYLLTYTYTYTDTDTIYNLVIYTQEVIELCDKDILEQIHAITDILPFYNNAEFTFKLALNQECVFNTTV